MSLRVKQTDSRRAIAPVLDECRAIGNRGYRPTANWVEKHLRMCFVLAFEQFVTYDSMDVR